MSFDMNRLHHNHKNHQSLLNIHCSMTVTDSLAASVRSRRRIQTQTGNIFFYVIAMATNDAICTDQGGLRHHVDLRGSRWRRRRRRWIPVSRVTWLGRAICPHVALHGRSYRSRRNLITAVDESVEMDMAVPYASCKWPLQRQSAEIGCCTRNGQPPKTTMTTWKFRIYEHVYARHI